ncbi:MAG: nitroreductase family protein [Filifactoraceae bacterium]
MEFEKVVSLRQSVRKFKEDKVPREDLLKMAELAGKAPSGKNIQNWHFVFVEDQEKKDKIAKTIIEKATWIGENAAKIDKEKGEKFIKFVNNFTLFFTKAPVLAVVYTTDYRSSGTFELEMFDKGESVIKEMEKRNPGMQNLGAAMENFSLAAVDMGYGSCWLTSANYACKEIEALLKEEYGFEKEGYYMGALLALGKIEGDPKSPPRKPVEDIVSFL